jgi:hypothetical protein
VSEEQSKKATKHGISVINAGKLPTFLESPEVAHWVFQKTNFPILVLNRISILGRELCEVVLSNEELMQRLEKENFDLVMIDGLDPLRCMYVVPYRLGVKYITVTARHDPWHAMVPALPSIESAQGGVILGKDPSFLQRLKNTVMTMVMAVMLPPSTVSDPELITKYAPKRAPATMAELYHNSEMWIVNIESLCLDYPRLQSFHYQFISCLNCEPTKPLNENFATFADGATDGLIVISFGSGLKTLPDEIMTKMMRVFGNLPQRVIMRYEGNVDTPKNVMLSPWIPQNDLLGHKNTRLFITHAGNNGQQEALYHGVAMLSMTVFGDQVYNAERVVDRGYGLMLNAKDFTEDQLRSSVDEILSNPKYTDAIKKCSKIFHAMPDSQKTILFWANHVLEFGGSHLKPPHMEMPIWKVLMLDIIAFFLLVMFIICACLCRCCKMITRCCRPHAKLGEDALSSYFKGSPFKLAQFHN